MTTFAVTKVMNALIAHDVFVQLVEDCIVVLLLVLISSLQALL